MEKRFQNDRKENPCYPTRGRPHVTAIKTPGKKIIVPQIPPAPVFSVRIQNSGPGVGAVTPATPFSEETALPSIKAADARTLMHQLICKPELALFRHKAHAYTRWSQEFHEGQTLIRPDF